MRRIGSISATLLSTVALNLVAFSLTSSASEANPEWQVEKGGVPVALKAGESEALSATFVSKGNYVFKPAANGVISRPGELLEVIGT